MRCRILRNVLLLTCCFLFSALGINFILGGLVEKPIFKKKRSLNSAAMLTAMLALGGSLPGINKIPIPKRDSDKMPLTLQELKTLAEFAPGREKKAYVKVLKEKYGK